MFIVWGTKITKQKLGYVADFCPICREPQPFQLRRIGSVGHLYYVSYGHDTLVRHEIECQECHVRLNADPARYDSVSKESRTLFELVSRTYPNLDQAYKERLSLEARIAKSPSSLSPELKRSVLEEPFLIMSAIVEERFSSTKIDKETGFSILVAVGLFIGAVYAAKAAGSEHTPLILISALLMGLTLITVVGLTSGRRFMKRRIVPIISRALSKVRPTEAEVSEVLATFKGSGRVIGRKLRATNFASHVE